MNLFAVRAIFAFELARSRRTLLQSIAAPVISTSLYFVVFGSAIGGRMTMIDGVSYGAFIVPGLIMLALLTESVSNASFGIYLPRFTGTIYELLSAPVSVFEVLLGYVGAAATKSIILGLIILATARVFVPFDVLHPVWAVAFLVLISVTFSLFGFILGVWADGFEKLQLAPLNDSVAAHVSWRDVLFDRNATAAMADNRVARSGGLLGQWFSLGLLRYRRRRRRNKSRHDRRLHVLLHRGHRMDLPDRLSAAPLESFHP